MSGNLRGLKSLNNVSLIDTIQDANSEMQILRDEMRLNGTAMASNGYSPGEAVLETDIADDDVADYCNYDEAIASRRTQPLPSSMVTDIEDVAGQQLLHRLSNMGISQPPPVPPPRGTHNTRESCASEQEEDDLWLQSPDNFLPPPVPPRTRTGNISAIGRRFENAFKGRTAELSKKLYASHTMLHSLLDHDVLTKEQVDDIKHCSKKDAERNIRLMDILTTRPDQCFETFIIALRESGQHEVANILTK